MARVFVYDVENVTLVVMKTEQTCHVAFSKPTTQS